MWKQSIKSRTFRKPDGEYTEFTIQATMRSRWVPHFLAMLKRMQYLGAIGSSREVTLYADGDGDFRPKFEWDDGLSSDANPRHGSMASGNYFYDAG